MLSNQQLLKLQAELEAVTILLLERKTDVEKATLANKDLQTRHTTLQVLIDAQQEDFQKLFDTKEDLNEAIEVLQTEQKQLVDTTEEIKRESGATLEVLNSQIETLKQRRNIFELDLIKGLKDQEIVRTDLATRTVALNEREDTISLREERLARGEQSLQRHNQLLGL